MTLWVLVLVCAIPSGCVQRRMTIRSNPPGALVYVDDYEIGTTPVSTDFIYYGTRKIRLVKPGYETLTVLQPVPTPWYQWPALDFVSENLVPWEIRDERNVDYQLQPQLIPPQPELMSRAEELRRAAQQSVPGAPVAVPTLEEMAAPPTMPILPNPNPGAPILFAPQQGAPPTNVLPSPPPYGSPPAYVPPQSPPAFVPAQPAAPGYSPPPPTYVPPQPQSPPAGPRL